MSALRALDSFITDLQVAHYLWVRCAKSLGWLMVTQLRYGGLRGDVRAELSRGRIRAELG